jgi:hypothetical protein
MCEDIFGCDHEPSIEDIFGCDHEPSIPISDGGEIVEWRCTCGTKSYVPSDVQQETPKPPRQP